MKTLRIYLLILLLALSASLPTAFAQRGSSLAKPASIAAAIANRGVDTISAAQLRTYLSFIASDEMEGRDTPSRGLDTVAKFIALNLTRWGLKPVGDDGTFFQRIALQRTAIDAANARVEMGGQSFTYGDDFIPQLTAGSASGQLVYAGH